jgi:hypothetical protein
MVVEAALGAALRVAPGPHAHVHGVNRRFAPGDGGGERIADEQPSQGSGVDPSVPQRRVEAAPPAAVGRLEAQVDRGGHHPGGKEGIAELEERVGAVIEAAVDRVTEGAQGIDGFHEDAFCYQESSLATPVARHRLMRLKHNSVLKKSMSSGE